MELIKKVVTVRDLLRVLQSTPDYMLDLPVDCGSPDGVQEFNINLVEIIDIIEEGNRMTIVRLSGEELD